MIDRTMVAITIASLGLVLGIVSGEAVAQMPHQNEMQRSQNDFTEGFQQIEQPLGNKIGSPLLRVIIKSYI